jgi:hypothetical protein
MSNVLSVRLDGSLLARLDRKAASLGRRRTEHVRQVLEADLAEPSTRPTRRFACLPLKGKYSLGNGSDNASVRQALARRAHEKNR